MRRRSRPAELLVACPRISPEWELAALRALMKPQAKERVRHRSGAQPWPSGATETVDRISHAVAERLGMTIEAVAAAGEFHWLCRCTAGAEAAEARALALAVSRAAPAAWFVVGRVFVRGGRFYRRERGVKLRIVPAANVRLPRAMRITLRGLL